MECYESFDFVFECRVHFHPMQACSKGFLLLDSMMLSVVVKTIIFNERTTLLSLLCVLPPQVKNKFPHLALMHHMRP